MLSKEIGTAGSTTTLTELLAPLPSLAVAVMIAVPARSAVILPVSLTEAISGADELHSISLLVASEGEMVTLMSFVFFQMASYDFLLFVYSAATDLSCGTRDLVPWP